MATNIDPLPDIKNIDEEEKDALDQIAIKRRDPYTGDIVLNFMEEAIGAATKIRSELSKQDGNILNAINTHMPKIKLSLQAIIEIVEVGLEMKYQADNYGCSMIGDETCEKCEVIQGKIKNMSSAMQNWETKALELLAK